MEIGGPLRLKERGREKGLRLRHGRLYQAGLERFDEIVTPVNRREDSTRSSPQLFERVGVAAAAGRQLVAIEPLQGSLIGLGLVASVDPLHHGAEPFAHCELTDASARPERVRGNGDSALTLHQCQQLPRAHAGLQRFKRTEQEKIPVRSGILHAENDAEAVRLTPFGNAVAHIHGIVISDADAVQPLRGSILDNLFKSEPTAPGEGGMHMEIHDHGIFHGPMVFDQARISKWKPPFA